MSIILLFLCLTICLLTAKMQIYVSKIQSQVDRLHPLLASPNGVATVFFNTPWEMFQLDMILHIFPPGGLLKMIKRLIPIILTIGILLSGCTQTEKPSPSSSTSLPATTASTAPIEPALSELTDEELIRRLVASGELENWALQSTFHPNSGMGLLTLVKNSAEFHELVLRPNGMVSLRNIGPSIIEETLQSGNYRYKLQGHYLSYLIIHLYPSMEIELNEILAKYPLTK